MQDKEKYSGDSKTVNRETETKERFFFFYKGENTFLKLIKKIERSVHTNNSKFITGHRSYNPATTLSLLNAAVHSSVFIILKSFKITPTQILIANLFQKG